jgi:hypothetical protein
MPRHILFYAILLVGTVSACINSTPSETKQEAVCTDTTDNNPNGSKPLARMMRTMTNQCDSMRLDLMAGKKVDSIRYPMPDFIHAESTEANVKTPVFYAIGSEYEKAYRRLMSDTLQQKENYMAVIQQCRACHMNFCSGPLRKIDKLVLE